MTAQTSWLPLTGLQSCHHQRSSPSYHYSRNFLFLSTTEKFYSDSPTELTRRVLFESVDFIIMHDAHIARWLWFCDRFVYLTCLNWAAVLRWHKDVYFVQLRIDLYCPMRIHLIHSFARWPVAYLRRHCDSYYPWVFLCFAIRITVFWNFWKWKWLNELCGIYLIRRKSSGSSPIIWGHSVQTELVLAQRSVIFRLPTNPEGYADIQGPQPSASEKKAKF